MNIMDILKKIIQASQSKFKFKFKTNSYMLLIAALLYLFIFFIPGAKGLCAKLRQCAKIKRQIQTVNKDWGQKEVLKKKITRIGEKINYYEKKLPGEKEIPAILENLSRAAQKLNVRISEIKPLDQVELGQKVYYSVPILVSAECGYHQLGRFINALEKADRFMKISDIKIEAASDAHCRHQAQLIVVTYVMKK